jgi:hypothetical protein
MNSRERVLTARDRRIPDRTPAEYKAEPTVNRYMMEHYKVNYYEALLQRLIDVGRGGGVKFMTHSCGAIRPIIPDLIGLGIDMLDPIQVAAEGMEPPANIVAMYQPELRALTA